MLLLLAVAPSARAQDFDSRCAALLGTRAGLVMVADPNSGRLLAVVHPGLADSPAPPGSVFKLVTALAAIQSGVDTPGEHYVCKGRFRALDGRTRPCWKPGGHGRLTLEQALAESCNVTFYQLGERVGLARLDATARHVGLGSPGSLPSGSAELLDACIGEGKHLAVTPRQLLGLVCAIATDGRLRRPAWTPRALGERIANDATLARLRKGMVGSVLFGSSHSALLPGLAIAGKTGTATYVDGSNRTYGWFVGFAPATSPRVAIVVFLPQSSGLRGAAPLGRRVFETWLAAGRP
ncbi:MAG TPA: penicillin-binding transpeptidase domain-containing protein [Oscillatoriaceae cyanobacterium]